jgi:hypothetical protein
MKPDLDWGHKSARAVRDGDTRGGLRAFAAIANLMGQHSVSDDAPFC